MRSFFLKIFPFLVFAVIALLFVLKLDHAYFFTDEILYIKTGADHLKGIYTSTLQVPVLPKYIAGALYTLFNTNIYLMRLPFALTGIATAVLLYFIVKREYGSKYGLVAAALFTGSNILFDATRMVMLEPLMHLFWLLFHFFFYSTLFSKNRRLYVYAGLFFGLSLGTKLTSIVLIPFTLIVASYMLLSKKESLLSLIKNYFVLYFSGAIAILVTYIGYFAKLGIITGIKLTKFSIENVYLNKSSEGKLHVIGSSLYQKSPWWTYFYYLIKNNGFVVSVVYALGAFFALFKRNVFVFYWAVFLVITFAFLESLGVKNARYISSFELPLIVLCVSGIHFILERLRASANVTNIVLASLIVFSLGSQSVRLTNTRPSEYEGVFRFFKVQTNNFTKFERMYIFGSIRSVKWYRAQLANKDMLLYRRDFEVMCPEFSTFKYIVFDKDELLKAPNNMLFEFVQSTRASFDMRDLAGMVLFTRKEGSSTRFVCPDVDHVDTNVDSSIDATEEED